MDILKRFIDNDAFAEKLGIVMIEYDKGRAKAKMPINNDLMNSAGTVHGGAIFSLADAVFAVASNSHGTLAMAINVSISYFKAVKKGILYASAKEISINPKLATYIITVTDDNNDKIALFQGTVYKKNDSLETVLSR